MKLSNPFIKAIAYYLPANILTNNELAIDFDDWDSKTISEKTGISSRHYVNDELVSDLAFKAAQALFNQKNICPTQIDFILLCTQSPDYFLPSTVCLLHKKLQLPKDVGALDFNLGCSGFIYGLALAKSLVQTQLANNVLLINADTYTRFINKLDKSTRTIFGDGAAATLICSGNEGKIGKFVLGTDGQGADKLIVPAGGMSLPKSPKTSIETISEEGYVRSQENLFMAGPEIVVFTLKIVPQLVKDVLDKNNLAFDEVDLFVFHQANKFILDKLKQKLGIPNEKFYVNIEDKGNTVSASIPIALKEAEQQSKLRRGYKVMLVGFGVGYSWGATIIEW